jgi:hypothetical protein
MGVPLRHLMPQTFKRVKQRLDPFGLLAKKERDFFLFRVAIIQ